MFQAVVPTPPLRTTILIYVFSAGTVLSLRGSNCYLGTGGGKILISMMVCVPSRATTVCKQACATVVLKKTNGQETGSSLEKQVYKGSLVEQAESCQTERVRMAGVTE